MLTVHHLGLSQSERIVWLCEELEIPYVFKKYDRDPVTRVAPSAYKAIHPAGTAPVITDGDVVLSETSAIVDYLLALHGRGRFVIPPGDPEFANYLFWLHYANGTMQPAGLVCLMMSMPGVTDTNGVSKAMKGRLDRAYDMIEQRLASATYFAGDRFTAADIIMVYPLTRSRVFIPRELAPYPHIRAYLKRIAERPAYKRAMAKGDPGHPPLLD